MREWNLPTVQENEEKSTYFAQLLNAVVPADLLDFFGFFISKIFGLSSLDGVPMGSAYEILSGVLDREFVDQLNSLLIEENIDTSRYLNSTCGLGKTKVDEVKSALSIQHLSNEIADDVRTGALSIAQTARLHTAVNAAVKPEATESERKDVIARSRLRLLDLTQEAQRNNSPVRPQKIGGVVKAVVQEEFSDLQKTKEDPDKMTVKLSRDGHRLSLGGPKEVLRGIFDHAQANNGSYIKFVQDADGFVTFLNSEDSLTVPQEPAAEQKKRVPKPAHNNDVFTQQLRRETYESATAASLLHGALNGVKSLCGDSNVNIQLRSKSSITRALAYGREFRLVIDHQRNTVLSGGDNLRDVLGHDPITVDAYGNWIIPVRVIKKLATTGCSISLATTTVEKPKGTPDYKPSEALRQWALDRNGGCMFPGCECTHDLQFDHINPYIHSLAISHRQTVGENVQMLCPTHHRLKTLQHWSCWTDDGGLTIIWRGPDGTIARTISHGVTAPHLFDEWEKEHHRTHPCYSDDPADYQLPPTMTLEEARNRVAQHAAEFLNTHPISPQTQGEGDFTTADLTTLIQAELQFETNNEDDCESSTFDIGDPPF